MNNCLNCKSWNRLYENPDVGTCDCVSSASEAYRFQFELCDQWSEGKEREPYYFNVTTGLLVTSKLAPNLGRIAKYYAIPFGETPKPKTKPVFQPFAIPDEKLHLIVEWKQKGCSNFWIAKKMGVSQSATRRAVIRATEKGLM